MDGAIEPYRDVFTGVSRSATPTTRLGLQSTFKVIAGKARSHNTITVMISSSEKIR
jgi:hypothetical protein